MEEFRDPVYWASLNVYGRDSLINVEELQRSVAEAAFVKAQKMAVERFEFVNRNEGNTKVEVLRERKAPLCHSAICCGVSMFDHLLITSFLFLSPANTFHI